jgi:hypothetical protein
MPDASFGNFLRFGLRRLWRMNPAGFDELLLALAKRLYPSSPQKSHMAERRPRRKVALSDGSHFHGRWSLWMRSGHGLTRCRLDPVARDPFRTSETHRKDVTNGSFKF